MTYIFMVIKYGIFDGGDQKTEELHYVWNETKETVDVSLTKCSVSLLL